MGTNEGPAMHPVLMTPDEAELKSLRESIEDMIGGLEDSNDCSDHDIAEELQDILTQADQARVAAEREDV